MLIKTGGKWGEETFAYFIASNVERMTHGANAHDHLLVAVNELKSQKDLSHLKSWIASEKHVLIDSGVYNLAMEHASKNNASHDEALNLPPDKIDGFDNLFTRYCEVIEEFGDDSWGYIEIDQGGKENKTKTRQKLEKLGFSPIPVYHPFGDGWDYFDYLAEHYDRICFGNVVQASRPERLRLVATAWERHRKYPNLWIHLLGLTPNEWLYALPINSGDSSSWLSSVRWSGYKPRVSGRAFGGMDKQYQYKLGSDSFSDIGSRKATKMSAYGAYMVQLNWRNAMEQYKNLGCEIYPPKDEQSDNCDNKVSS